MRHVSDTFGDKDRSGLFIPKVISAVLLFLLLNSLVYWQIWHNVSARIATGQEETQVALDELGDDTATKGMIADYISDYLKDGAGNKTSNISKVITDSIGTRTVTTPGRSTTVRPVNNTYMTVGSGGANITPGSGIVINGVEITTTLGTTIDNGEISPSAVLLSNLAGSGCTTGQTIKYDGTNWSCAADDAASIGTNSGTANKLAFFSTSSTLASSILSQDNNGLWLDAGKDLHIDGVIYGDGAGITGLDGANLLPQSITNTGLQNSSVATNTIQGGAVTTAKLADDAVTLQKFAQSGCSNGQTLKVSNGDWVCASDNNTQYTAGVGLQLVGGVFGIDGNYANTWAATQVFDGGLSLGGTTFSSLAGAGLQVSNGALQTALGTSISTGELEDGSVTSAKIQAGTVALSKLNQNGCTTGQTIKWSGSAWACANDTDTDTNTTYTGGSGIVINSNSIALDLNKDNAWNALQTFAGGLSVNGTSYTNLAGTGLQVSGGTLATTLGTSIDTNEVTNGAVTAAKIADGAVTFAKFNQNGCSVGQVAKWNGTTWACAADASSSYTAGSGLSLNSGVFSLDVSAPNTWAALQSFTNGIALNGNIYTNLAGAGLQVNGGTLSSTLGASIDTAELNDAVVTSAKLADGAISFAKLNQNGCSSDQTIKWNGSAWVCISITTSVPNVYTGGAGLQLNAGQFSLDTAHANTWLGAQTFSGGLGVGANTYTDLAGSGLAVSNGTLRATLGTDIDASELQNNAVTTAKLAAGAVTFAKLGQNGCTTGQTIAWTGVSWGCADNTDTDTDTTYTAGLGVALNAGAFSLDLAQANTWVGVQTFSNGIGVNGTTYTNLAGTGLGVSGGTLSATLGTSIATNEIDAGAITSAKIANGAVEANALANGSVTAAKLGQNGCVNGNILKWQTNAWVCGIDIDTDTTFSAGAGLLLSSNSFSLDLTRANNWSGLQTFSAGVNVGGNTYSNLSGTGLVLSSGTLSTTLGTSIEAGEIADGAITSVKIYDGTIISADLADGAVTSAKILDGTISGTDIASGTITSSLIADGTITSPKLSAAVRKRTVTVNTGSIQVGLLSTQEQAIFIAPTNGTITKINFTSGTAVAAAALQGTISVERKTSPAATAASVNLATTSMAALGPVNTSLNAGLTFSAGDVYSFKYTPGTVGVALGNLLVTIEYTVSE